MLSPVSISLYMVQNIEASFKVHLISLHSQANTTLRNVALCLRSRDEGGCLDEWLRNHRAAGIDHFFLYNNSSADDFSAVLAPHLVAGYVTHIDWPHKPVLPAAPEFLSSFPKAPAVAVHWYYFGSNGHEVRPKQYVTEACMRRQPGPNRHVRRFVRPDRVTQNRNSHSWFFRKTAWVVDEAGKSLFGSTGASRGEYARIDHHYFKSLEDNLERHSRSQRLMFLECNTIPGVAERTCSAMRVPNGIEDRSTNIYFQKRCELASKDSGS